MKVLLANPRGFCAGVTWPSMSSTSLGHQGPAVYVYHEIVHNLHVVNDFRARGVTFVDSIDEVPEGGTVVYSAHGVSPAHPRRAKRRKLVEIDATCPLVTKVHLEVLALPSRATRSCFVGHRNHDEAIGTVGEAPESIVVVESAEEVERLVVPDPGQARLRDADHAEPRDAIAHHRRLSGKFPNIKAPPKEDICYATTNRQNAVTSCRRRWTSCW
jgi:4-hydroxy-3-methylbut-2-enyl diphosphate reductase